MNNKSIWENITFYIIGSVFLLAMGTVVLTGVMPILSGTINKRMTAFNNQRQEQDDWGPEIIKKKTDKEQ